MRSTTAVPGSRGMGGARGEQQRGAGVGSRRWRARAGRGVLASILAFGMCLGGPGTASAGVLKPGSGAAPAAERANLPQKTSDAPLTLRVRHRVTGQGATTLVLIHGNFDRLETWDAVVPRLSKQFRVVTFDLLGFGETRNPLGSYTLETLSSEVVLLLDTLKIDQAVIVGNSLGGAVAATFASRFPERTKALVLEDADFFPSQFTPEAGSAVMDLMRTAADNAGRDDPAVRQVLREKTAAALKVALVTEGVVTDALIDHFTAAFVSPRLEAIFGVNKTFTVEGLPGRVKEARKTNAFPILTLWGLKDPLIPPMSAERVRQTFPDSRLVLLEGCGHAPHLEQPEVFAGALEQAFGPNGRMPADDVYVAKPGAEPTYIGSLTSAPYLTRAVRMALAAKSAEPDNLAGLAITHLVTKDFEGAEEAAGRIDATAPGPLQAVRPFVEGALREVRGEPGAVEKYLEALAGLAPSDKSYPLLRLVRLPLTPEQARQVDQALRVPEPPPESESIRMLVARADRFMAMERYQDALDQLGPLEYLQQDLTFARTRRAWALLKLGRLEEAQAAVESATTGLRAMVSSPDTQEGLYAARRCLTAISQRIELASGRSVWNLQHCEERMSPMLQFAAIPPLPAYLAMRPEYDLPELTDEDGERTARLAKERPMLDAAAQTPSAAIALARLEVQGGQVDRALEILRRVPAGAADQLPAFHRMRLALAAGAGDAAAVQEARALAGAHPGQTIWQQVLATTLFAAGSYQEARSVLLDLLVSGSKSQIREELAYIQAAMGDLAGAHRILNALERENYEFRGTPFLQEMPHVKRALERLQAGNTVPADYRKAPL